MVKVGQIYGHRNAYETVHLKITNISTEYLEVICIKDADNLWLRPKNVSFPMILNELNLYWRLIKSNKRNHLPEWM